ncbi:MAG: DNRLRE domain-containing protein [Chloroflexi bacterium]|nr:DNRLRE domain-containing protein [Chloroflexota bacterium]
MVPRSQSPTRRKSSGSVVLLVVLVMGLVLAAQRMAPTWALPNQTGLHQSLPTAVQTPTAGPTATPTVTPATGVYRLLLQQGRDGYTGTSDTFMHSYWPDTTASDRSRLKLKGPDDASPIIRFDLTDKLPAGATIVEAELVLFVESNERLRPLDVGAFRVLRPWDLGWVTWNNAATGVPWGTPGCNRVGVDRLDTADQVRTLAYRGVYYGFSVTHSVIYWQQNPTKNYGWVIKGVSNSTGEFQLLSSLGSTPQSQRPMLRIDYRLDGPPPATATPSPTPTSTPQALGNELYALVYADLNGNGQRDGGELGLANVLVERLSLAGQPIQRGLTAGNGYSALGQPAAGDYYLRAHVPWGYYPTTAISPRTAYEGFQVIVEFGLRPGRSVALPMLDR